MIQKKKKEKKKERERKKLKTTIESDLFLILYLGLRDYWATCQTQAV
jgi:hypothetical protein